MHFPFPPERTATRLIEIVQTRGCFETEMVIAYGLAHSGLICRNNSASFYAAVDGDFFLYISKNFSQHIMKPGDLNHVKNI